MIRNHSRALGVAALSLAASSMALAQGWPTLCDDPSTTASIWSNTYGGAGVGTNLFGAGMSTSGTVLYELCFDPEFTGAAPGGIQFFIPGTGSVQTSEDDEMALIYGSGYFWDEASSILQVLGVRANWTYASLVQQDATGNNTFTKIVGGFDTVLGGASDRYVRIATTQANTRIELRMDVIGDAARVQWNLTNQGAATNLGLWFGQFVSPIKNFTLTPKPIFFINAPGYRPITTMRRFQRNPNLGATDPPEYAMPAYMDFMPTQSDAYSGLKIINTATSGENTPFPDQTSIDGLDVGLAGTGSPWLLGPIAGNDANMPDIFFDDIDFLPTVGYIQKWNPRPVGASDRPINERRVQIVAYYKTTWGDSDFSPPYNVTIDPPKVIATQNNDPFSFQQNQYTVRAYVDNTRGFSTAEKEIQLENVQVKLVLPQGLADANDASRRVMTRTITRVDPKQMTFVDFQVQALPTTFGVLQYSVEIRPQTTSPMKIVTGNIVVGSQPYLLIRNAANLVTAPWVFANGSWASILGSGPDALQPDIDYQAFTWDASLQQYVLQTGPQRGVGTWIISNKDVAFKRLGGGPQQPQDLATGAPLKLLKSGWNLIANPYSYPIQLGQLVGVSSANNTKAFSYQELVDQGVISSSLSYWDEGTQTYKFIGSPSDLLMPNTGYWINVLISGEVTLSYPPVFIPFIPQGTGGINSKAVSDTLWTMNLVAKNSAGMKDDVNTIGFAKTAKAAAKARVMEPPISPLKNAISAAFPRGTGPATMRLARDIREEAASRAFVWNVYTKKGGNVTLTWPDAAKVPTKYRLTFIDEAAGKKINMRSTTSYTFNAAAQSAKDFKVVASVMDVPLVDNVSAFRIGNNMNDPVKVAYTLSGPAVSTVRILQNGTVIRTLLSSASQSTGSQYVMWNLLNSSGKRAAGGTYQAEVSVVDEDGTKATKTVNFLIP